MTFLLLYVCDEVPKVTLMTDRGVVVGSSERTSPVTGGTKKKKGGVKDPRNEESWNRTK